MTSLSKFAICLSDQHLQHSTLMGQITSIIDQTLLSIHDVRLVIKHLHDSYTRRHFFMPVYVFWSCFLRILTTLMISVSSLVSVRLRDALIERAGHLLDNMDISNYNSPRRLVQFLRNVKHSHRPLLEKCNKILLCNIPRMDAENICIILGLYQSLQFNNCDFMLAAKQRLTELVDLSTDPFSFTKLFVGLAPMASQETKERFVTPRHHLLICEPLSHEI